MRAPGRVLVSAHRCESLADIEAAIALGVDYVELDVFRRADGSYVVDHDGLLPDPLAYDDALAALAGRAKLHLDLKVVDRGPAVEASQRAVEVLGADAVLVTTLEDAEVRAVRDWSEAEGLDLLVGLSLGRSVRGMSFWRRTFVRTTELLPGLRYRVAGANLVVANHWLARFGVAAFARRTRRPLLVWTVDTEESLHHWLRPGRAWLVTTNEPGLALKVRAGFEG